MSVQFRSVMTESGKGRFYLFSDLCKGCGLCMENAPSKPLAGRNGLAFTALPQWNRATEKNLVLPVKNVKLFAPNVRS